MNRSIDEFKREHARGGLTSECVGAHGNRILHDICLSGDLPLAKWLYDNFEIARVNIDIIFRETCSNAHLDVAEWLAETFKLTSEEIWAPDVDILPAIDGLPVLAWIVDFFGPDPTWQHSMEEKGYAIQWACTSGNLDIARWLFKIFEFDEYDLRRNNNELLMNVVAGDLHVAILDWLFEMLDVADVQSIRMDLLEQADPGILQFFVDRFGDEFYDYVTHHCRERVDMPPGTMTKFAGKLT
jgi:hypothetical protein